MYKGLGGFYILLYLLAYFLERLDIFSVSQCRICIPHCEIYIPHCGFYIPQCETENSLRHSPFYIKVYISVPLKSGQININQTIPEKGKN